LVVGLSTTQTTSSESQVVGNDARYKQLFYQTDMAVTLAAIDSTNWLHDAFVGTDPDEAVFPASGADDNILRDLQGNAIGTLEVRCITDTNTTIASLSQAANDLPEQIHQAPPPAGSGYSLRFFQTRRYGMTVSAPDNSTQIQLGVYKVFNK